MFLSAFPRAFLTTLVQSIHQPLPPFQIIRSHSNILINLVASIVQNLSCLRARTRLPRSVRWRWSLPVRRYEAIPIMYKVLCTCQTDVASSQVRTTAHSDYGGEWCTGGQEDEEDKTLVRATALSPKGTTVASGGFDGKVRLWDVETGKVISKWTAHSDTVDSVSWSKDGQRVLSGSRDG
ncbi:WD40 repeat-like protein, partial [Suillus decipiens]